MKKILFIIPSLHGGGAERVFITLLKHLPRGKIQFSLAVINTNNAVYLEDVPKDVELIDLHRQGLRYAIPQVIRIIRKKNPDLIFSTIGQLNLVLVLAKKFFQSKLIIRESNVVSVRNKARTITFFWNFLYRFFYKKADCIVCQSKDMLNDLTLNYKIPESKMVLINNPITDDVISYSSQSRYYSDKQIRFVASGRFVFQKGFDLLIKAFSLIDPAYNYRLDIFGKGDNEINLHKMIDEHKLTERIYFHGFIRNPYPLYAQADAFISSSRFEGFPNVILEALACGTPVIATPALGGIQEIIGDIPECVIADELTAESLARAIERWIQGDKKRIDPKYLNKYRVKHIVKQYEDLFLNI